MSSEPVIVQALHAFKGTNNDELCFKKGDKITITQKEEGGWWEGTLGDKTGWFPSNYVKEIKVTNSIPLSPVSQRQYRAVVLKDLIDSERAHVTELQGLVKTFLKPLEKSTILTNDEYKQLTGNINEVLETHQYLLELLEECESKPSTEQRVGKLFLNLASKIKTVHQTYCASHPRAVCILDLHKDDLATYMESCGAATPGLLVLVTGLSKPFRRLDKYSGMLQELERHVETSHPDRGDTQRSVEVFRDIAATCAATRRQKELELQVLTGPVRGWEGQSLAQLGDILHMGSVAVGSQHQDRYFVLFPNTLLVLSVSQRMSAFIYEGKLPLTGITVSRLEDNETQKNAFEISGPMIEKIVAICQSKEEANNWVDLLRQHTKGQKTSITEAAPIPPPHLDPRGYSIFTYLYNSPLNYNVTLPPSFYPPTSPYATLTKSFYRLVKEKVITQRLLKKLLYPEYEDTVKLEASQIRVRRHRTECFIKTCSDTSDSDNNSYDSDGSNVILHRQNAIISSSGSGGSIVSNPFGFIRYFNPKSEEVEENKYESFIDHSKEIPIEPEQNKAKLCVINQISQESGSSFECSTKPYMAYEDLLNIDESLKIETLGLGSRSQSRQYVPKTRQSLPTKMVANKFNKSSLTLIYIPTWQSNSESNLATKSKRNSSSDSSDNTTTHSSCLDLPVNPLPVPDQMLAEILYNTEPEGAELIHSESIESDQLSTKTVINPTSSKNRNEDVSIERSLPLRLSNVCFKTHSINSDKPKRASIEENHPRPQTMRRIKKTDSIRKCISYHYLQLAKPQLNFNTASGQYCRCCTEPGSSRRSSDSGMAGSCTLNSPDSANATESLLFVNRDQHCSCNLSEIEAQDFEAQCRCTSPFGSTPRTSCQASTSDNIFVGAHDSTTSVTSSSSSGLSPYPTPYPWESEKQIYDKVMKMKRTETVRRRQCDLVSKITKSKSCGNLKTEEEEKPLQEIFCSGLYAHWWMKAKLPNEVMFPLATSPGNRQPSITSSRSNQTLSNNNNNNNNNSSGWSATCIRPNTPIRPCLALGPNNSNQNIPTRSNRKTLSYNDDAHILKVIEAYCNATRPKNTISTAECRSKTTTESESERSNLKSLQNHMQDLERSISVLMVQLAEEKVARCTLQAIVKTHMTANNNQELENNIQWPPSDI